MSKEHIQKNLNLSLEFDSYMVKHPNLLKKLPKNAQIVLTEKKDVDFSNQNMKLLKPKNSAMRFIEARKEGGGWKIHELKLKSA